MRNIEEAEPREAGSSPDNPAFELAQLSTILSDIDAVLWEARAESWECTFISRGVERILGHPLESWHGDTHLFFRLLHPDDRDQVAGLGETLVRERGSGEIEYRLRDRDDRYRWFRDCIRVVSDETGEVRLRGVAVECTRHRWEREWNAANRRVLELIARGTKLEDVLHRIVEETERQLPGTCSSMVLVQGDGTLRSGPAPSFPDEYRRAVETLSPGEGVGSCGTAIWRRERVVVDDIATDPLWSAGRDMVLPLGLRACWSQPIFASDGTVLGAFAIYNSTPSRPSPEEILAIETSAALAGIAIERHRADQLLHQSEEQLRQLQKMDAVGRLAGGMAHDFNNILTAIFGHAESIALRAGDDSGIAKHSQGVLDAARRAAAITRRLLAVSRKQFLELRALELNDVVEDLLVLLRGLIGEDIELIARFDPAAGRVLAEHDPIGQILINLAVNARDAMPGGGKLVVETSRVLLDESYAERHVGVQPGEYVLLAVTDTGKGMDAETQARAFEPFFTTKGVDKGTGLGLSIVYGIVKQLSGHVWIYSEPGCGTTFKVYLPAHEAVEQTVSESPVSLTEETGGGRTVLVVEDQGDVRELVSQTLQTYGFDVLTAENGEAALATVRDHGGTIDLVLTDVVMPSMGGRELARQLQAERPQTPVLFMSGYTETTLPQLDPLEPGTPFIEKPFSPAALAGSVASLLGTPTRKRGS